MTFDATFWVTISFFIFIGILIYFKIPQKVKTILEQNILDIKNQISEAEKLKEDAKNILIDHLGASSVATNNELNLENNTITVAAFSDIDGVLDFDNGGIFDANGTFDATGGTVQFTGTGGTLKLGGATVTSLGNTLTEGSGTIEYDYAGNQTVLSETYYNLTINNTHGSNKVTPGSAITVTNVLNINDGILATPASDYDDVTIGSNGTLELTGNITVSGDWSDAGLLTPSSNTVTFDGSSAQSITSNGSVFHTVTISNTSAAVSIADKFEFATGTLTINSSAIFALAGNEFDDNGATITNNPAKKIMK